MANSAVLTGLTTYVDQNKVALIGKAVTTSKTQSLVNVQTGIKGSATLNVLNTNLVQGDGSACGWNEAGTQEISQRVLKTGAIKINMAYCDKKMLQYYMQNQVRVAAGAKVLPFEEQFVDDVIRNVVALNEKEIWQGDATGSTANLNRFDGFLKVLSRETSVITGATVATSSTAGKQVFDMVNNAVDLIPSEVFDNAVVFVGQDDFRTYAKYLTTQNLYHYAPTADGEYELQIPGTITRLIGVAGLNGQKVAIAGDPMNFYVGTDMESDDETFEMWYSQDDREFRLAIEYVMGVQVAFPDQIVKVARA